MNINFDIIAVINFLKNNPLVIVLFISIGLLQVFIDIYKKLLEILPSTKKDLLKFEELKNKIDYEQGAHLKQYIEEIIKKLHFKLTTGMFPNEKNKLFFELYLKNRDLSEWELFKNLNGYITFINGKAIVEYNFFEKFKTFFYYAYFGTIISFAIILCLIAIFKINQIKVFWVIYLLIFIVLILFLLLARKREQIKLLKLLMTRMNQ